MPSNSRFQTTIFGGLNKNDQSDQLLVRSHQPVQGGWVQKAPLECTEAINIDFDNRGIKKRLGSTLSTGVLSGIFAVNEFVVNSVFYTSSATNEEISVIVSNLSIYTDYSGSYQKINDSSSNPYNHNEEVSKCTFAITDGHLFIGLNANNKIQVYRNGLSLDDELDAGNTYNEAFGTGTQTITGVWGSGYYLLTDFQGRLVYSDGNTVVNYSTIPIATDGIWNKSAHGFYQASGAIVALKTFTPDYQDSIQETLYIFTAQGIQITNNLSSQIQRIEESSTPLNYKSIVATKSWLIFLTKDRQILAINRNTAINIGRRFANNSGTAEIDDFDLLSSKNKAFATYNRKREQVYFFVPERGETKNSVCFVLDLQLSEPSILGQENINEQNVRLSIWKTKNPSSSPWFSAFFYKDSSPFGVCDNGDVYNFLNGRNDFGNVEVEAVYETLDFNAGISAVSKQWMMLNLRGQFVGNYTTVITYIIDKDDRVESTTSYNQTSLGSIYGEAIYGQYKYNSILLLKGQDDIDIYSESVKIRIENNLLNQTFRFDTIDIEYLVGGKDR